MDATSDENTEQPNMEDNQQGARHTLMITGIRAGPYHIETLKHVEARLLSMRMSNDHQNHQVNDPPISIQSARISEGTNDREGWGRHNICHLPR